ncbi:hypothetical protein ACFWN7_11365 [Agromyces sp. NPDC058484]|uniref:hypothetical protein n=1 Tax=Agromyces sp. NPDC058484 TaxID=3346524 RepID=UPI003647A62A
MRQVERTPATERGRRSKAEQFAHAVGIVRAFDDDDAELVDAIVTLCVHAGIAVSDVICMKRIGSYVQGENHTSAIAHLHRADSSAAKQLEALLRMKTKAGYGYDSISRSDRAGRSRNACTHRGDARRLTRRFILRRRMRGPLASAQQFATTGGPSQLPACHRRIRTLKHANLYAES